MLSARKHTGAVYEESISVCLPGDGSVGDRAWVCARSRARPRTAYSVRAATRRIRPRPSAK